MERVVQRCSFFFGMHLKPQYCLNLISKPLKPSNSVILKPFDFFEDILSSAEDFTQSIWAIKRTYQPSVIRRKRKWGFLKRNANKLGRKIIARRLKKGRKQIAVA
mmetsp:Transcript_1642/g.2238  ORF Transcript_1642/g.2238 Transcript_1642/m.2238 type:complete len:105 (-) Transcript_1642:234-548(-)